MVTPVSKLTLPSATKGFTPSQSGPVYGPGSGGSTDLRGILMGRLGRNTNVPPTIEIFDPPDDRYFPGFKITDNMDGDVKIYGPRLKDLNVPFSLYGLPVPITWGVRRLMGNIIWAKPLRESVQKKKTGGGKGGGPTTTTVTYAYYATFAVGFGIAGNTDATRRDIIRQWAQGSLVYDRRGEGNTRWKSLNFTYYPGGNDQLPDPTIEAQEGVGNVPAYRDIMYCVYREMPIETFGNFIPSMSIEIGDATTQSYIIRNIETPVEAGSTDHGEGVWDPERFEYYSIRAGETSGYIRTYNLLTRTYQGKALVNQIGVGWLNNNGDEETTNLAYEKGISDNFTPLSYIPWLNLCIGKADSLNLQEAVMLFDPTSGIVTHWIGVHRTVGSTNPTFPINAAVGEGVMFQGTIPQWRRAYPFQVYSLTGIETWISVATVYSDIVLLKIVPSSNKLDMVWFKTGLAIDLDIMSVGEQRIGESDFYYATNADLYRMKIPFGARRVATVAPSNITDPDVVWTAPAGNIYTVRYFNVDNSMIVITTNGFAHKVSCVDYTTIWSVAISNYSDIRVGNTHLDVISAGVLAWCNTGGNVYELDLTYGTVTNYPDASGDYEVKHRYFDSRNYSITGIGEVFSDGAPGSTTKSIDYACSRLFYNRIADNRMLLALFIEGLALYAGYLSAEIDISADIDDTIDGAIINKETTFKAVMSQINTAYRIEMFESEGVIKFVRRALGATTPQFVLTDEDFIQTQGGDSPQTATLLIRREEELSVPQRVNMRFIDKSLSYQWNMETATRSQFITTNLSDEQLSLELPIIMTASEAKTIVHRILWQAWNSRVSYGFQLPKWGVEIEPGDFGTVTADGRLYNIRVVQVTYNTNFTVSVRAVNSISDESVTLVGDSGGVDEQSIPGPTSSEIYILDIPLLRAADDLSYTGSLFPVYYYIGPLSFEQSWGGGSLYESINGVDYSEVTSNAQTGLVCIVTDVPAYQDSWMSWDETNTFTVYPKQGDKDLLESSTHLAVLAGANLAAYGRNGRWELISFREVVDNGDGSFTLSGILRGRNGSDFQLDNHQTGDLLVLITDSLVELGTLAFTDLDIVRTFKPVGADQGILDVTPRMQTIYGYGALPLPPSGLRASRTLGGSGDIVFNWDRRGRVNGSITDNVDNAPLTDNESNDYKLTIYRWPHYDDWTYTGGVWVGTDAGIDPDSVEVLVTGATTYTLNLAAIRAAEIYEFSAPDIPTDALSAFSQHGGAYYITANADENIQMPDLGWGEFVAFRYIDVMIQQKTSIGNDSGYGPGRRERIYIRDL